MAWPRLSLAGWADTRDTLHLRTQVVGKIRMAHAPVINHWWHVTLDVSARGLTTSTIPHQGGAFEIEFDIVDHQLHIGTSEGERRSVELAPKPVAAFCTETMDALDDVGIPTRIHAVPKEVDPAIPFAQDHKHTSYDACAAHLLWRQLPPGATAPGRRRAQLPGLRHARGLPPRAVQWGVLARRRRGGAFYAYAYPEPDGYAEHPIRPADGSCTNGEFVLPYEAVATAPDPDRVLGEVFETTCRAAADLGGWVGRRSSLR